MMHKLRNRAVHTQGGQRCSEPARDCETSAHPANRAALHGTMENRDEYVLHECDDFRIGLAAAHVPRSEASRLIERRYSWRGYHVDGAKPVTRIARHITLVASSGTHVFGTLTIGIDSHAGLQVDELYGQEMQAIRARQRAVCEFTRLAVDPEYGTKEALAALFHVAFLYASRIHGCDEIVIEVNPRHVAFYKRMLGFLQAGPERLCPRVAAPAVLLRLACTHAAQQIEQRAARQTQSARSLYPYFLDREAAEAVFGRASLAAALNGALLTTPGHTGDLGLTRRAA